MGGLLGDLAARGYWGIPNYAWQLPELRMADSQTTHRIEATRWTLHNASSVDAAQGVCGDRCTPDVTLSFIHYIRKLTLHHIMAYDHPPHYTTISLTHSPKPNHTKSTTSTTQINTSTWLAQCIYAPSRSTLHAQCTCQAHIHNHMFFVRTSISRSSPTSFRICKLTPSSCLVFIQFNASCRAICLLFSRLFLAILWACHRFLFFSLCTWNFMMH
jgi:hypothetical protein